MMKESCSNVFVKVLMVVQMRDENKELRRPHGQRIYTLPSNQLIP